ARRLFPLLLEPVSDPPDGLDEARVRGVVIQLGAQAANVHVDGTAVSVEVVPPDVLEKLLPGEDHARPASKLNQQVILLCSQRNDLAVQAYLTLGGIDS